MQIPDQETLFQQLRDRAKEDFNFYLDALTVKSGTGPKELRDVMASHQRKCFNDLGPAIMALRDGKEPSYKRFWIERTKKGSKDTDIAACILYLLCFPTRPLEIQIGAVDRDQAAIARDRINDFLYYNPWLQPLVKMSSYKGESKNGLAKLEIVAADIGGSHGATPDLLVCNELSHVTKWEFIQNLLDNVDGVPNSIALLATNAGFKGSEPWKLRQQVMQSSSWCKHVLDRPAPWHNQDNLKDADARNSPSRHKRLWYGVWASGKGDALESSLIEYALGRLQGPTYDPESGWQYVMGIDLGVSHDHAGVVLVGVNQQQRRIKLCRFQDFDPQGKEVNLIEVTDTVLSWAKHFNPIWVGYDPHQAVVMSQVLRKKNVPVYPMDFTPMNLGKMAEALKMVLESKLLEAYDTNDTLLNDLGKLNIVEKTYGLRLEAVSDASGHADVATALVICLPKAIELLGSMAFSSDDSLDWTYDRPLQKEEFDALPTEFKELWEDDRSSRSFSEW